MATPFEDYDSMMTRMEQAEERAAAIVSQVRVILTPLLTDWKTCYLKGLGDVPPSLLRESGGAMPRNDVDVGSLHNLWPEIQNQMKQYVDAMEEAKSAYARFSPDQKKKRVAPPPWEASQDAPPRR
jgi:hypothetical protein